MVLILLNQWLKLTMLWATQPRSPSLSPGDEKKRKVLETTFNLPWIELSNITIKTTYLIRRSFCSSVSSFSFLPSPVNYRYCSMFMKRTYIEWISWQDSEVIKGMVHCVYKKTEGHPRSYRIEPATCHRSTKWVVVTISLIVLLQRQQAIRASCFLAIFTHTYSLLWCMCYTEGNCRILGKSTFTGRISGRTWLTAVAKAVTPTSK